MWAEVVQIVSSLSARTPVTSISAFESATNGAHARSTAVTAGLDKERQTIGKNLQSLFHKALHSTPLGLVEVRQFTGYFILRLSDWSGTSAG